MKIKKPLVLINYPPVKVSLDLLWYDAWIGAFWDRKQKTLYVCPLPCCVIKLEFGAPKTRQWRATSTGQSFDLPLASAEPAWAEYRRDFGELPPVFDNIHTDYPNSQTTEVKP